LELQGFEVVPFKFSREEQEEAQLVSTALISNQGLHLLFDNLTANYEEPCEVYKLSAAVCKLP